MSQHRDKLLLLLFFLIVIFLCSSFYTILGSLLVGVLMCFLPKYSNPGTGVISNNCPPLSALTVLLAISFFVPTAVNSWPALLLWLLGGLLMASRFERVCLSCCCSCCSYCCSCCCESCLIACGDHDNANPPDDNHIDNDDDDYDVDDDDNSVLNERLIPKVLVREALKRKDRTSKSGGTRTILPRPSTKGLLTIPQCINNGHRATR